MPERPKHTRYRSRFELCGPSGRTPRLAGKQGRSPKQASRQYWEIWVASRRVYHRATKPNIGIFEHLESSNSTTKWVRQVTALMLVLRAAAIRLSAQKLVKFPPANIETLEDRHEHTTRGCVN